jgi:N-acyl-L-homoserine lactone synthetase
MNVIHCREARSAAERAACARLRADVYVRERGWVPADRVAGDRECDTDDWRSVHLLASRGSDPVGTVRLILRRAGHPLPSEAMLDEPLPEGRTAAEVSRLAVDRRARGDGDVLIALCAGLYSTAVRLGIDDLYAMVEKRLHRHLVHLGFPFRPVGESRWIYESWNFPVTMAVAQAKARLLPVLAHQGDVAAEEVLNVRAA